MPIIASDLLWRLATTAGAAGNSTAGNPLTSLGKYVSTTAVSPGLHGLFPKITGAQNVAGQVDYRCVFVVNTHASLTLQNAAVWLSGGDPAGGANVALAVDTTAASALGSAAAQALTAASATAPGASVTGLAYSSPSSAAAGVPLGNIGPGQCRAFWVRRTATNSAATASESVTLAVTGDTAG